MVKGVLVYPGPKHRVTVDSHGIFAGIDMSLELSSVRVVDAKGKIVKETKDRSI